jgi:apolipoprotein N-acyltransferase
MKIALAVASGLMVAGLFPPFNFSALIWVAMIPLLAALVSLAGRRGGWKGFGLGFLAGAVSCLIQFNWISTVSWLGAVILPLYLALFWGAFGAFAATWGNAGTHPGPARSLQAAFSLGAVWAGLEWLRGWLFTGFSWNALGVGFHENQVMSQGADLLGVSGLSLLLVAFQAVVVFAVREFVNGEKSGRRWDLGVVGLLALALFGYGNVRIAHEARTEAVRLKALLVQINIPQDAARVLWSDLEVHQAYEDETLDSLAALKTPDGGLAPDWPDWVVWPETALTGRILRTDDGEWGTWQINYDSIAQVREAGPFSLIYGVTELEAESVPEGLVMKEGGRYYNSIAVMSPDDELQTYRKRHLVIFGETIPLVNTVPFLKKFYEQQSGVQYGGSFTPGDSLEPVPILAGETAIGAIPTVCFEDSVARLARKFVRPGPQVIVNVTNDGWFKESPAAAQHFANSRFRTIELRRPMLRAANTGVSAAVDSAGSTAHPETGAPQVITDAAGRYFTRGSLLAELDIPLRPSFSLFVLIGDWGIIGLGLAALVTGRLRHRRKP